jgi:hypothetical protein
MARYDEAKAVALGFVLEPPLQDFNTESFGVTAVTAGMRLESPYQYFNKQIEPPSEIMAQKAALSLFSEYDRDKKQANKLFAKMSALVSKEDQKGLAKLLEKERFADWFSFVFLTDQNIDGFYTLVSNSSNQVKTIIKEAAQKELNRLLTFKELLVSLTRL